MLSERLCGDPNPSLLAIVEAIRGAQLGDPQDDCVLLGYARHQLDLLFARCTALSVETDAFSGYTSPCQWLREEAHLATGQAMAVSEVSAALEELPLSKHAMDAGEIGFSHLAAMAEARQRLAEHFDEARLLGFARKQTVTRFRKTVEHELHATYPERFAAEEAEATAHRFLHWSPQDNGAAWLKGWLDPEGASVVRAALEPLAKPAGKDDERTRDRRLGDALVELAGEGVRTELVVSMSLETLVAAHGTPAAETEWGGVISSEAVRRLLCDADVRRLVLDGQGEVLELGRTRRLFSKAQRKALAARDARCVFRGCDRPPRWCEGHHLKAFAEGGGTDVAGGALLCMRHHNHVHHLGWKVVRDGPGFRTIPPVHQRVPAVMLN